MSNVTLFQDREAMVELLKTQIIEAIGSNDGFAEYANIEKITDAATLETAKRGYKLTTSYITGADKSRKKVTSQIDAISKDLRVYETELTEPVLKVKEHLKTIIDDWNNSEAKRIAILYQERMAKLTDAGYKPVGSMMICGVFQLTAEQIQTMEDEDLEGWLNNGLAVVESERKQNEEKQAMLAELEELRKMKAEIEREKQELAAQQAALENTYAKPEPIPDTPPVVTAPSLEFDIPTQSEPIQPVYDTVSFNAGVNAVIFAFENNHSLKKDEYINLFKGLLLPL